MAKVKTKTQSQTETQPAPLDKGAHCLVLESAGDNPFAVKLVLRKHKVLDAAQADDLLAHLPLVAFKDIAQHEAKTIQTELTAAGATVQQTDNTENALLAVKSLRQRTEIDRLNAELAELRRKLITAQNGHCAKTAPPAAKQVTQSEIYDILNASQRGNYNAKRDECQKHGWPIILDQSVGVAVHDSTVKAYVRLTWIETQPAATQPVNQPATVATIESTADHEEDIPVQENEPAAARTEPFIVSVTDINLQLGQSRPIKPTAIDLDGDNTAGQGDLAANPFVQYREKLAAQREANMIPFRQALERARQFRPSAIPGGKPA